MVRNRGDKRPALPGELTYIKEDAFLQLSPESRMAGGWNLHSNLGDETKHIALYETAVPPVEYGAELFMRSVLQRGTGRTHERRRLSNRQALVAPHIARSLSTMIDSMPADPILPGTDLSAWVDAVQYTKLSYPISAGMRQTNWLNTIVLTEVVAKTGMLKHYDQLHGLQTDGKTTDRKGIDEILHEVEATVACDYNARDTIQWSTGEPEVVQITTGVISGAMDAIWSAPRLSTICKTRAAIKTAERAAKTAAKAAELLGAQAVWSMYKQFLAEEIDECTTVPALAETKPTVYF